MMYVKTGQRRTSKSTCTKRTFRNSREGLVLEIFMLKGKTRKFTFRIFISFYTPAVSEIFIFKIKDIITCFCFLSGSSLLMGSLKCCLIKQVIMPTVSVAL